MTESELLELIAADENSGVEFKRDDVRPEELAREAVAMANLKGGHLLLGVEDDGAISGLQRENTEEWVMDTVFTQKVHPLIIPFYEEVPCDDGMRVAVITLAEGVSKPYVVRHHSREEIYVRLGSTSRRATREQQARLHQMGGMLHTELLPVSGADLDALDGNRLADYLREVTRDQELPDSQAAWIRRLRTLGFMTEGPQGTVFCTIAGLILFGAAPRRRLRQAGLRVMVFEGPEKTYRAVEDRVLDAPLIPHWPENGNRRADRQCVGLFELADEVIAPYLAVQQDHIEDGFRRNRVERFGREVVRELLVNAFAHRDWTRTTDVELTFYSNRMEVISPGALPNTMTIEKMIGGQRSPRNSLIVDALRDYGYVDARGMGIRNKVIPLVREATGKDPAFEETEDFLKTTVPATGEGEQRE